MFVPVPGNCDTRDIDQHPILSSDTPILARPQSAVNVRRAIQADINADFFGDFRKIRCAADNQRAMKVTI